MSKSVGTMGLRVTQTLNSTTMSTLWRVLGVEYVIALDTINSSRM